MTKILLSAGHTDAELREFVRVIRAELLRRQQERAAKKYRERNERVARGATHDQLERRAR